MIFFLLGLAGALFGLTCLPSVPDKPYLGAAGLILCAAVYALKLGL